jgi:hypothetical protein
VRFPGRDVIATGLVAVAGLVYVLWATGSTLSGLSGTRASGIVILALGFAASASAVVPGFDQLLRGNKAYLTVTACLGVVALLGGVAVLIAASDTGLGVLMAAMVVLWLIATFHHMVLAQSAAPSDRHTSTHGPALSH